ncbi:MAG: hypothetical protein IKT40_12445 [Bacilli bacterium]|nr:hypothetical protein [Bacilli bacterium]
MNKEEQINKNLIYTKKELRDMGFAFDLNGNILTPKEAYKMAEKHIEHRKKKLIDKACKWLEENTNPTFYNGNGLTTEEFINNFIKAMNK